MAHIASGILISALLAMRLDNTPDHTGQSTAGSGHQRSDHLAKPEQLPLAGHPSPAAGYGGRGGPRDLAAALLPALDHQNGFGRRCGISGAGNGHPPAAPRPLRLSEIPGWRYLVAFFSGMCAGLFGINMFLVAYLQRTAKDYDEFKGSICFLFLGENLFRTGCISAPGS